jgi:Protein of unknown function (DUF2490)
MQAKKNNLKVVLIALFLCLLQSDINAQTEWQNWNGITVSAPLTNKLSVRLGHTRAYNITNNYESQFSQTAIQLSYDLKKRWDVQSGIQFITPAGSRDTRTRIYIRGAHTVRLAKKVMWTNSFRLETNSKSENRFTQRFIYTTRLGLKKRLDFLHLAPSISYSLFYNMGGNPINYYDKAAVLLATQTADGFHRSRFTINLNSKISPYFSLSVYYLRQQEFNLFAADTRAINVFDPVNNRTQRPFNNYNTIGITGQFNLEPLFKK